MFRYLATIARKKKFRKAEVEVLGQFHLWKNDLLSLSKNLSFKKLLIIRVDDIGDYILFRNFLFAYKLSPRWQNHELIFLGNVVWKDLFEALDIASVCKCIWINKPKYLSEESYRVNLWKELREQNVEAVVCASRTRLLLIDDLCAMATGAKYKIGSANNTFHKSWNDASNKNYNELFQVNDENIHEFHFNKLFTEWCCKMPLAEVKLALPFKKQSNQNYIVCFIGVSTKSRQWPLEYWIKIIKQLESDFDYKILIAGSDKDIYMAQKIATATNAQSIAGKTSLIDLINIIANTFLIITNDTVALHMAAACGANVILLSNGNNYYRFAEYKSAGFEQVHTLYSKQFSKALKTKSFSLLKKYIAVTKDISSIKPKRVKQLAYDLLKRD